MPTRTDPRSAATPSGWGSAGGANPPPERARRQNGIAIAVLVLVISGLLLWALWATFADEGGSAGPDVGVTLTEVVKDPSEFYGDRVVVSGQIERVHAEDDVITRSNTAAGFRLGTDATITVVGANIAELAAIAANEELAEGDVVQVSGTVREFDLPAIEEDLGVDFDDDLFGRERAVIVADAVNLVPVVPSQGEQLAISVEQLEDDPTRYLGRQVTVTGASVTDVLSPRVFAISDEVLVVSPTALTGLRAGEETRLRGTAIEVSTAKLLTEFDLRSDRAVFDRLGIDRRDLDDYDVLILADSVRNP